MDLQAQNPMKIESKRKNCLFMKINLKISEKISTIRSGLDGDIELFPKPLYFN